MRAITNPPAPTDSFRPSGGAGNTIAVVIVRFARALQAPPEVGPALPVELRRSIIALAFVSALSALAGGGALLAIPRDVAVALAPPAALLAYTPFTTFLVPGLLLTFVVGGTSLAAATLMWRRSRYAVDATVLAGGTLTIWIIAEMAMFRSLHWLHVTFGVLGVAILALGVVAARVRPAPRITWTIAVTAGEALGFLAPVVAGVVAARAGASQVQQALLVVAAGCIEGFCLGAGQAWAWSRGGAAGLDVHVDRARYASLMAVGAGVAWACAMSIVALGNMEDVPAAAVAVVGVVAGAVGVVAVAGLPLLELRRFVDVRAARAFFTWTVLAWIVALPMSFLAAPFVDEGTPFFANLALWASAGAVMAYTMALLTWRGARAVSVRAHGE